jgi:hypothetical protein
VLDALKVSIKTCLLDALKVSTKTCLLDALKVSLKTKGYICEKGLCFPRGLEDSAYA